MSSKFYDASAVNHEIFNNSKNVDIWEEYINWLINDPESSPGIVYLKMYDMTVDDLVVIVDKLKNSIIALTQQPDTKFVNDSSFVWEWNYNTEFNLGEFNSLPLMVRICVCLIQYTWKTADHKLANDELFQYLEKLPDDSIFQSVEDSLVSNKPKKLTSDEWANKYLTSTTAIIIVVVLVAIWALESFFIVYLNG